MRKRICIISYSSIKHDARVLRQITYLAPHYDLTVIGFGDAPDVPGVTWQLFPYRDSFLSKLVRNVLQTVGHVVPAAYDLLELCRERYWKTLQAVDPETHAVLADDLTALAVAAHAARRTGAKLVFDAHEFSPLEQETPKFKRLETPNRTYLLRKYAQRADATMTVCTPIAERYAQEFGFHPLVVMNAPKFTSVPDHAVSPNQIRLITHGVLQTERKIEGMIRAVALADKRYELHLMLIGSPDYIDTLRHFSDEIAPGRIFFHDPVEARAIVSRISEYDLGIFVLPPTTYGFSVAMPNKFFDFMMAGLGVIIGPTPTMAQIVESYGFGVVAPSFEPQDAADVLNALTVEQIVTMRAGTRAAAAAINADTEMAKVIALFDQLLLD